MHSQNNRAALPADQDSLVLLMSTSKDPEIRRQSWEMLRAAHFARTKAEVERMERDRGLR